VFRVRGGKGVVDKIGREARLHCMLLFMSPYTANASTLTESAASQSEVQGNT
jgi:hypothetical protein